MSRGRDRKGTEKSWTNERTNIASRSSWMELMRGEGRRGKAGSDARHLVSHSLTHSEVLCMHERWREREGGTANFIACPPCGWGASRKNESVRRCPGERTHRTSAMGLGVWVPQKKTKSRRLCEFSTVCACLHVHQYQIQHKGVNKSKRFGDLICVFSPWTDWT